MWHFIDWYSLSVSSVYVLSLYAIPLRVRSLPRDEPLHVYYRILASSTATILALLWTAHYDIKLPELTFLESIGVRYDTALASVVVTVILMAIFYLGPLVVNITLFITKSKYLVSWRGVLTKRPQSESLANVLVATISGYLASCSSIILFRNLIFAPVTEEVVFRGLLINGILTSRSALAGTSLDSTIIPVVCCLAPAWFAVAHVHHLLEKIVVMKMSVASAVVSTLVQMTYTSIFGAIASYLLLKTGNIISPITSHMICNFVGLPDLGFMTPPSSGNASELSYLYPYRYLLLTLHALGLVLFVLMIDVLVADRFFLHSRYI